MEGEGRSVSGAGKCGRALASTQHNAAPTSCAEETSGLAAELAALKLGVDEIIAMIVAMQQERLAGDVDPSGSTSAETNRPRRDCPRKLNYQPWPNIINQEVGKLGRFPGDECPTHFDKYFIVKNDGDKRKMNPFIIEKEITQILKGKPSDISSTGRNGLLITVRDASQSQLILKMSSI